MKKLLVCLCDHCHWGAVGAVSACSGNRAGEEQEVPSWPVCVRGRMRCVFVLTVRYQSRSREEAQRGGPQSLSHHKKTC